MIEKEFILLNEYLKIYIQLLPYCKEYGGNRIYKSYLPTFEYFKQTYNDERYSLATPVYKESIIDIGNDGGIISSPTRGLGTMDGIGYKHYNYWMGCQFFTGNNIKGDFTYVRK